jgi:hypothetical protein
MLTRLAPALALAALGVATGCGDPGGLSPVDLGEPGDPVACDASAPATRTASCVLSVAYGPGAGFGQDRFPDVVFGPPQGGGPRKGGTDVLSLGAGGHIALGFGGGVIVDGPGPDFIVFENAFDIPTKAHPEGDPAKPFAELGVVAVSDDGETWRSFACAGGAYPFTGCAGWHAVDSSPDDGISPFDPAVAGGDAFDLATIGLAHARFVRVTDRDGRGSGGMAGFDLDAVAVVNLGAP